MAHARQGRAPHRLVIGAIARALVGAVLLPVAALAGETLSPGSPGLPLDQVPTAERFVSPVGNPDDFAQPAPGETHGYALTRGVQRSRRDRHLGLDLSNRSSGGEVRAPADGIVIDTQRRGGWGQLVVIAHRLPGGDLVMSLLAHLKPGSICVKPGDRVRAGQPVGTVGSSGRASGPHLHLELRRLEDVNPLKVLWERAPEVDPLRILGSQLAKVFLPGEPKAESAKAHWGDPFLRAVSGARGAIGDPEVVLERREFYTWLARLSGARVSQASRWTTVRRALARRGLSDTPTRRAAIQAPVGGEEAARALARLLAGKHLRTAREGPTVPEEVLSAHHLRPLLAALDAPPEPGMGPERPLSRAEGAALVVAARPRPAAAERRP